MDWPRGQPAEVDPGLDLGPEAAPQVEVVVDRRLQPEEHQRHRRRRSPQRLVLVLDLVPLVASRCGVRQVMVADILVEVVQLGVL